jgi:hypothetical protein
MNVFKKIMKHPVTLIVIGCAIVIGIGSVIQRKTTGISLPALVSGADSTFSITSNSGSHPGFGFNEPWMYGVTHGPSTTFAEMTAATKYLNNPIIRFPGGTVSRAYHINLPGYDGTQSGETQNYIIPFTNIFAPNNTPLTRISFVANLDDHFKHITYKGSDEDLINDNIKALTYLLDHGFQVPIVELGNEEYLTPELFWSFGSNAWKPLENLDQNIKALTEIKLTYALNVNYQRDHFKQGMDKYTSLIATYQNRINALMDSRGLPRPKYGVSIPAVAAMTYGDTTIWNRYYSERVKALPNIDALIPHYYSTIATGKASTAATNLQKTINDIKNYYGSRRLWFTEFSAGGGVTDDSYDQITALNQMAAVFDNPSNNTDYYFLHQFFKDSSDYGMIYKNITTNSKPVNSVISSGRYALNTALPMKLFYSPRFCWAVQMRGASSTTYNEVKSKYGCR